MSSGEIGEILILVAAIMALVVPTTITTIVKRKFDNIFKKQDEDKEKLRLYEESKAEKLREQQKQDMKEAIEEAIEPIKQDLSILKRGTQAGLRHDLVVLSDEWIKKGYCPRHVKVDFEQIYTQYHALGKNGVMDNTYKLMLELPEIKPKAKTKAVTTTSKTKTILNEKN